MVVDAVRTYIDAASGLTELSRKEAVAAAKALLRANGPASPAQGDNEALPPRLGQSIQTLAGELIETSQSNRAAIADLIRSEVGRQLERMDVVPRAEHDRLVRRVAELERRLAVRHAVEHGSFTRMTAAEVSADTVPEADTVAETGTAGETSVTGVKPQNTSADADMEASTDTAADTGADSTVSSDSFADDAGPADSPDTDSADAEADTSGTKGTARSTTTRAKARATTKSTAKTTRSRATTKRTAKGKGSTKK